MESDKSVQCGYYQVRLPGQQLLHRTRIPLKHIDQIKSSVKQMIKINVTIQIDGKFSRLFEIDGNAPVYVSSVNLDDERLKDVDIRVGDYIVMVNGKNVSRAVAQSVRKIIKSSKTLQMTLYRSDKSSSLIEQQQHQSSKATSKFNSFWSGIWNSVIVGGNKRTPIIPSCIINNLEIDDNESDHGYCSIPRTSVSSLPRTQCSASTSSSSGIVSDISQVESKQSAGEVINKFKSECDYFLNQLQQAVDVYVRPSMVSNILTINECFNLYQNIEKLVPVTRFMTNVLFSSNQSCLPNADMLKIVFDSFKTYLLGLPNAINLLSELTSQNEQFVEFLDNVSHHNSFKILDLLFMPLNFVKLMVEFLRGVQKIVDSESQNQNDANEQRFKLIIADLYECSVHTYQVLEQVFEKNANHDDEWSEMSSLAASVVPYDTETTPVSVKFDGCDEWVDGRLCLSSMQIQLDNNYSIELASSSHVKKSKCGNLFYLKAQQSSNQDTFLVVRLNSQTMRNYVFDKISCLVF